MHLNWNDNKLLSRESVQTHEPTLRLTFEDSVTPLQAMIQRSASGRCRREQTALNFELIQLTQSESDFRSAATRNLSDFFAYIFLQSFVNPLAFEHTFLFTKRSCFTRPLSSEKGSRTKLFSRSNISP